MAAANRYLPRGHVWDKSGVAEVNLTSRTRHNQENVSLCLLVGCNRERCGLRGIQKMDLLTDDSGVLSQGRKPSRRSRTWQWTHVVLFSPRPTSLAG